MFIITCIIVSLIPVYLFLVSINYLINQENKFNNYILYETKRSMLSREAKEYSKKFIAKLWCIIAPLMLIESIHLLFKYKIFFKRLALYLIIFQISVIWFTVIPVECRLKRKFDKEGKLIKNR